MYNFYLTGRACLQNSPNFFAIFGKRFFISILIIFFHFSGFSIDYLPYKAKLNSWSEANLTMLPNNYCTSEIYQCINISGVGYLKMLDISTNPMSYSTVASYSGVALNSMGYNTVDGKFYAVNTNNKHLVSITTAGVLTDLNVTLPISPNCGDIDTLGNFYFKSGSASTIYKINLNNTNYTVTSFNTAVVFYGADMAFNPYTNRWYAVRNNIMSILNPTNNTVTNVTVSGLLSTAGDYGANWFASDGYYYVSRNASGTIYKINLSNNTAAVAGLAQITNSNDGARCPMAAMVLFPPVAGNNAVTVQEDNSATIPNIVADDTDVDGTVVMSTIDLDPNTVGQQTSITTSAGTWSVNTSTGVVSFVPVANYNGNATITYTVQDNTGRLSNEGLLTVVVNSVNDVPVANNNSISGQEDQVIVLTVIDGNDVDLDGTVITSTIDLDVLTAGIQSTKTTNHGTFVLNTSSGDVTFTPVANWYGTTTLNYTIQDNQGAQSYNGTLSVTLTAINDGPIITADATTGNEDAPFINLSQITNNDVEPEAEQIVKATIDLDPYTVGQQTTKTNAAGSWSVNLTDGTVTFVPASNFYGLAQLAYTVADINGNVSAPGFLNITVNEINDGPLAQSNSVTSGVNELATLPDITLNDYDAEDELDVSTIDLDPNTAGQQTTRTTIHGTWTANTTSGAVTFMPITNYLGTTSIQYTIKDLDGVTSNVVALTATIILLNQAPHANNDVVTGLEDAVYINIPNVQNNDTDPDGNSQILTSSIDLDTLASGQQTSIQNSFGSWSVDTGTGTVTYHPATNFYGVANAYYKIKDINNAWSNVGTLTINVTAVNDAPWATKDSTVTNANITVALDNILANDWDLESSLDAATVDLDTISSGLQTSFSNSFGTWTYNSGTQVVYYAPTVDYVGMAYAYYKVNDTGGATSRSAMLQVEVFPKLAVNSTPNPNQAIFSDCGSGAMISTNTNSWNSSWTDYNNDGWEDLYVTNLNTNANNQLFRAVGNGNFSQISNINISNQAWTSIGSLWGDIDNDGDQDVLVINDTEFTAKLFTNNGNETFSEVTNSGLNASPQYYHGGAFADFDNDGYLDLMMTNYFDTRFHELYRNNGNGTFTAVNNTSITLESRKSLGPVWGDYNNDGNQDLFIPNGGGQNNSLFKNNGNGSFTKITSGAIVTDGGNSVGACWGDYDNDGDIDLFVANASDENNFLYRNNGNETFTKITSGVIVNDGGHSHGCHWVDVDNDGDKDLYVTNDEGPKFLYINDGAGSFERKANEDLAYSFGNAFGQSWADFDKDGDMDVYVSTHSDQPNALFCNAGNSYNWVSIKLQGTVSNKDGIGARVKVKSSGIWQTSQVAAQNGFNGQHSMRQHFGLATATVIDSIFVYWPSGIVQKLALQDVNEFMTIVEPNSSTIEGLAYHDLDGDCVKDTGEPTLANMLISVTPLGLVISTDANGNYMLSLSPGSYSLDGINHGYWENNCSAQSQTVVGTSNQYTLNIPFEASANGLDLTTGIASTAWRRGFSNLTALQYSNTGTAEATNVVLTVTYPANVVPLVANIPWTSSVGQTYTWNIGTMPAGSTYFIQITDSVKLEAVTGQSLELRSNVTSSGSDVNSSNNLYAMYYEIVGPFDPNDMRVYPIGDGTQGFVDRDQLLTYTVRFQNIGTYPATNVVIKSQLPEYLDRQSFQAISASHSYTYHIGSDGALEIIFNQINLPDSTSDEAGSHGVVSYHMRPLHQVSGGEIVDNLADIHFDFEEPVRTNQVRNTLRYPFVNEADLVIWPNPSDGPIQIAINESQLQFEDRPVMERIVIYDARGRLVVDLNQGQWFQYQLQLAPLEAGIYQVVVHDNQGRRFNGRFTIRRS
jgi:ASPIC and UnbV/FG-GAP-like repeat/Bacterial Ig domain/Secretion system C-terminal sorting domain/Domain of unknown function DUF11